MPERQAERRAERGDESVVQEVAYDAAPELLE